MIVLIGTPLCALAGLVWAGLGYAQYWWSGLESVLTLFVIFGVVPLLAIQEFARWVARRRSRQMVTYAVWAPGLVYLGLALYSGFLLGSSSGIIDRGDSGSEFVPLVVSLFWVYSFVPVAGVALIAGLVSQRRIATR